MNERNEERSAVVARVGEFTENGHCKVCYRPWTYDAASSRFVCRPCEAQREAARAERRFTTEERRELYRLVHELESAAHDRAAALAGSDGEAYDATVRRLRAARVAFDDYVHGTEEG